MANRGAIHINLTQTDVFRRTMLDLQLEKAAHAGTRAELEGMRAAAALATQSRQTYVEGLETDVNRLAVDNEQLKQRVADEKKEGDVWWSRYKDEASKLATAIKERDEAIVQISRFLLGTAHGAKCWLDEHGWHCGEGCSAKGARQCGESKQANEARRYLQERDEAIKRRAEVCERFDVLAGVNKTLIRERDEAREQLVKLEWTGKERAGSGSGPVFIARTCSECHSVEPSAHATKHFAATEVGHKPRCWFTVLTGTMPDVCDLTTQIPQYKHHCADCIFLGRWERSDLYVCNASKRSARQEGIVVSVPQSVLTHRFGDHPDDYRMEGVCASQPQSSPAMTEARRRSDIRLLTHR